MPFVVPYAPSQIYQSNGRLVDLLRLQGEQTAEGQRRAGEIQAQMWGNLGQSISQGVGNVIKAQEAAPAIAEAKAKLQDAQQLRQGQQLIDRSMQPQTPQGPAEGGGNLPTEHPFLDENGLADPTKVKGLLDANGLWHLAPQLLKGIEDQNTTILNHQKLQAQLGEQQTLLIGDISNTARTLRSGGVPIDKALDIAAASALATKRFDPQQYAQVKAQILSLPPEQQDAALGSFMDAAAQISPEKDLTEGGKRLDRYNRLKAENPKGEKETEASIAYDLSSPDPEKRRRAQVAMSALKPHDLKPGTVEDWVGRARTLAAQAKGSELLPDEIQAVDTKAIGDFRNLAKDPELSALVKSNDQLRNALLSAQLGQQPTADDAKLIAQQVVEHKMAPSQVSMFGGFGTAGAAFKRMVGVEAVKTDPNFNWEQAEADYAYSKSPTFQGTVRFIDSTMESMPQLLKNAKALSTGDVKSINGLIASGKTAMNNVDLKKFKTDVVFVGDEIAKILQGGGTGSGTTDAKLKQAQDIFSTSDNPALVAGTLEEINTLLGYRQSALTRGTYRAPKNAGTVTPPTTAGAFSAAPIKRTPVQ